MFGKRQPSLPFGIGPEVHLQLALFMESSPLPYVLLHEDDNGLIPFP